MALRTSDADFPPTFRHPNLLFTLWTAENTMRTVTLPIPMKKVHDIGFYLEEFLIFRYTFFYISGKNPIIGVDQNQYRKQIQHSALQ